MSDHAYTRENSSLQGKKISSAAVVSFLVAMFFCCVILAVIISYQAHLRRLMMEQLIMEKCAKATEIIHKLLYKTEALAALVIQSNGKVNDFERVASALVDDPAIFNVLIAPAGVVTHVYPLRGNEGLPGFDFFKKGPGNEEAVRAKKTGKLVFGGPFPLAQGGGQQALVGRLPVYIPGPEGEKTFWGLVSVTLKYPQALDGVGLRLMEKHGYAFELWRINPDTGRRQIIAHSGYEYNKNALFIEKSMTILNSTWHFRISPVRMWYQYPSTWLLLLVGVFISGLVAFVAQDNYKLKQLRSRLEKMARHDALTGIFNRGHFMDMVPNQLRQAARNMQDCFIIMFDVDHFKKTNDTYGHAAGDVVLKNIAASVKAEIRPYDVFARYGGEEFIIFVTNVDRKSAENLATRIRRRICEHPVMFNGTAIYSSASFGLARASAQTDIDKTIGQADEALYTAKQKGRNRSVFYDAEFSAGRAPAAVSV